MSEETKAPDAVPENYRDEAMKLLRAARASGRNSYELALNATIQCMKDALALTEANRKLAEAEAQVQSENAELKTAYAQLARKEREMLVLRDACIELSQFLVGYDDVAEIAARKLRQALAAQEALSREDATP
jgi:hypothetical protein